MAYNPATDPAGDDYWNWKPKHHGLRGMMESMWHDSVGALIHGAERLLSTHGASAVIGPAAHAPLPLPPQPVVNLPSAPHQAGMTTLAPEQADIHNNFSTANQYQARFGTSQSHF